MNTEFKDVRNMLEQQAHDMGAAAFGVADLEPLKKQVPDLLRNVDGDYSRAIVMGMRLQRAVLDGIEDKPTPLYFHNYRQLNYQLDSIACLVADRIQSKGFRATAIAASQIIGRDPMRGHISHRHLGRAAGIGHIGRNNLLVHPEHGSQMRYVTVLTDMPLQTDSPCTSDCGMCRACVAVCPAKAIGESAEVFNLSACCGKLTEFTKIAFIGQHICGVCVKACRGGRSKGK